MNEEQDPIEDYYSLLPQKPKRNKKFIAFLMALTLVMASICVVAYIYVQSDPIAIDSNDLVFYTEYPNVPYEFGYFNYRLYVETDNLLWGNFTHNLSYAYIQTAQITPTILNLSKAFIEKYPNDRVLQVKAAYDFVAEEIEYVSDYYKYPITTLIDRSGACADYASLLASLIYGLDIKDVAIVSTEGFDYEGNITGHAYVAVYLPEYSLPDEFNNTVQQKIAKYLGVGWIGLDPTNSDETGSTPHLYDSLTISQSKQGDSKNYLNFGELYPTWEFHWNITTIVKVPIFGSVFDISSNWCYYNTSYDSGSFDFDCELFAFPHDKDDNVTFTFSLYQNDMLVDSEIIDIESSDELNTVSRSFSLEYDYPYEEYEIILNISP